MSRMRKIYVARLAGRIFILLLSMVFFITQPGIFAPIAGLRFFERLSILHLLWGIWMIDMLSQLLPIQKNLSIGSLKVFRRYYRQARESISAAAVRSHVRAMGRAALGILLLWALLTAALGALHGYGVLTDVHLFLVTVFFYVCDLICVLIWCPFRLMMGNRCCTTCRIFNWDHLMMFSPMLFVRSFYCLSLFFMALLVALVWEGCIFLHPERFLEKANAALQCTSCTDKLCTQYCKKHRD